MTPKFKDWLENRDQELHKSINEVNWLNLIGGGGAVVANILAMAHSMGVDPMDLAKKYVLHNDPAMSAYVGHSHGSPDFSGGGSPDPHLITPLGHGEDHEDHEGEVQHHLYGDKSSEEEKEKFKSFAKKLGFKKGPRGIVTLPVVKPNVDNDEEEYQDFSNVPSEIKVGNKWVPGINPISQAQAQYNQLMRGEVPDEPVNPQVAKFAAKMRKVKN